MGRTEGEPCLLELICKRFELDAETLELNYLDESAKKAMRYASTYCMGKMYLSIRFMLRIFILTTVVMGCCCSVYFGAMLWQEYQIYGAIAVALTSILTVVLCFGMSYVYMQAQIRSFNSRVLVHSVVHLPYNMNTAMARIAEEYMKGEPGSEDKETSKYCLMLLTSAVNKQADTVIKLSKKVQRLHGQLGGRVNPEALAALGLGFDAPAPVGCYIIELEYLLYGSQREFICIADDVRAAVMATVIGQKMQEAAVKGTAEDEESKGDV